MYSWLQLPVLFMVHDGCNDFNYRARPKVLVDTNICVQLHNPWIFVREGRLERTLHGTECKTLINYPKDHSTYLPYIHSHKNLGVFVGLSEYSRLYHNNLESVVNFVSEIH